MRLNLWPTSIVRLKFEKGSIVRLKICFFFAFPSMVDNWPGPSWGPRVFFEEGRTAVWRMVGGYEDGG